MVLIGRFYIFDYFHFGTTLAQFTMLINSC